MTILREWFVWGESDLLPYGLLMIVMSYFLASRCQPKTQLKMAAVCLVIFLLSAILIEVVASWGWQYLFLFAGGFAFCLLVGTMVRYLWQMVKNKNRKSE